MIIPDPKNTDRQAWFSPISKRASHFSSLGFTFPLTWSGAILLHQLLGLLLRNLIPFVSDQFPLQDLSCTFTNLPLVRALNIAVIYGLMLLLHITKILTRSKEGLVILWILTWIIDFSHFSTDLRCLPLPFLYFHISCSHEISLVPRPHQVKRTTTLVTRSCTVELGRCKPYVLF